MGGSRLLAVLHLCDSLFPLGGFAYSDGLEAATASGAIADACALGGWLDVCLDGPIARSEGPTLLLAWSAFHERDWDGLAQLDEEAAALRPSAAGRRASRAMGLRLAATWEALHPDAALAGLVARARDGSIGPALPVAFGAVCAASEVDRRTSAQAFAYNRLAATVSAAMRLMPIGQTEAHRLLAGTLARVPEVVDAMVARSARAESFAPAMDVAAMSQQYLHSRLFRS
jgi:urease accessory protein